MSGVATTLPLPRADGTTSEYVRGPASTFDRPRQSLRSRVAFAAAHWWPTRWPGTFPARSPNLDWDATLAYWRHLWSWGLGVVEAMDTAQRGAGLDWPTAAELIRRSVAEAIATGGRVVCGRAPTISSPAPPAAWRTSSAPTPSRPPRWRLPAGRSS